MWALQLTVTASQHSSALWARSMWVWLLDGSFSNTRITH
jgi:hypothetical protein